MQFVSTHTHSVDSNRIDWKSLENERRAFTTWKLERFYGETRTRTLDFYANDDWRQYNEWKGERTDGKWEKESSFVEIEFPKFYLRHKITIHIHTWAASTISTAYFAWKTKWTEWIWSQSFVRSGFHFKFCTASREQKKTHIQIRSPSHSSTTFLCSVGILTRLRWKCSKCVVFYSVFGSCFCNLEYLKYLQFLSKAQWMWFITFINCRLSSR